MEHRKLDRAQKARKEEQRFQEVFGEDPFKYTLTQRAKRWQQYRREHPERAKIDDFFNSPEGK